LCGCGGQDIEAEEDEDGMKNNKDNMELERGNEDIRCRNKKRGKVR
jgi:hypothetical protein